ncbi:glycosyltransferase [Psychrilyobacter atlanticus]|uniref:glycosyltransferase n=1 Tax=Psychrilyobacter atlanticus TaxID=271091 RepID=UPI0003FB5CB8|nr:glycosyltransferase [Psychrilyobacter atlanticus]
MKKEISLIVTIYNRLEYARNIILCLLKQNIGVKELIFADDGSSEVLKDYIEDLIPKCKFKIKHVYQEDRGFRLAKSRNNGVRVSEGDWLVFLDQDIIFGKNFVKEIINNLEENKFLMAKAYMSNEEERIKIQKKIEKNDEYPSIIAALTDVEKLENIEKVFKKDKFRSFLHKIKFKTRGAKIVGLFSVVSKKDFLKINGFDEKYEGWGKEDDDLGNRLFKAGIESQPIKFSEDMIHMYHPFDPTKKVSANEEYYRKRKKEISRKNYRCEYGVETPLGEEEILYEKLN